MALMGTNTVSVKAFFDKELAQEVVEKAAMKGLVKLANNILGEAKQQCPVDTGTLRNSGAIQKSTADKTVTISFNTPYALRQHEEHKNKAKYLERPFNERVKNARYFVEKEIAEATYKEKGKQWGY